MNGVTSSKDLKHFIDLADKFNEGEYAGAEGMYKLMYAIANRLLPMGVAGLIFVEEVTREMAQSRDANDDEREQREQEVESTGMLQ